VWKREIDGRSLTFRLAGINNQNFLMRDEETGSYWQQISGKAVAGPLRGRQLALIRCDELTFALWRQENPNGTVLRPVQAFASQYESKDWDVKMTRARTVVDTSRTGFDPRMLVIGVEHKGVSRAYVVDRLLKEKLVQDWIGGERLIVVVGPDGQSVRVFQAHLPGSDELPEFYRRPDAEQGGAAAGGRAILIDSVTGSAWNFQGCAIEGAAKDQCLTALPAIKDYLFDWQNYHPRTTVFGK